MRAGPRIRHMIETENFAKVEVSTADALRAWLAAHHAQEASVWLVTFKKHVAGKYLDRWAVLDQLVCFGWIDGIRRKLDADRTMQLISPRRQQSWAKTYRDRAARLIAEGAMAPPGQAAIDRAKALGLWEVNRDVDAIEPPADLIAALAAQPGALAFFEAAAPSYRRNVLRWIAGAKRAETRARRIAQTTDLSAGRKKVPQM